MPNRIIKESTFESERIASLSDFEFRLWIGLITQADDAGRGDARPAIIKGRVFALRDRVTVKDIQNALCALAAAGCVSLYTVGGKPYYAFPSWTKHQRIRDSKPKYPCIEDADSDTCDNSPQLAAICRNLPPKSNPNPIQSESESESECAHAHEGDEFAQFWDAYPVHKDRKRAEASFSKAIKKTDLATMLEAIAAQKRTASWEKDNGRYIPMPSTWLNGERWNDDISQPVVKKGCPDKPWEDDDLDAAERMFSGEQRGGSDER